MIIFEDMRFLRWIPVFLSTIAFSQLQTEIYSPISTFNQSFLGTDYIISNVVYNGSYLSSGVFNATATNLGLDHGIILTTGTVQCPSSDGPCGPNIQSNGGLSNGYGGFPLLTSFAGGNSTYNAAVIEFDFVPLIDSIGFRYVFGSEEYPEYAPPNSSSFHDVFGFFISGPGISGTQNIAKLPNGQNVTVSNVNPVNNSEYYVSNGDGFQAPFNQSNVYIQYDGFTTPLVASKTGLQINATYHMIIAIADVSDAIFDSGIFIEKCSDCTFMLSLDENSSANEKKLVGIYDVFGREIQIQSNTLLIYLYSDGTTEKVMILE